MRWFRQADTFLPVGIVADLNETIDKEGTRAVTIHEEATDDPANDVPLFVVACDNSVNQPRNMESMKYDCDAESQF